MAIKNLAASGVLYTDRRKFYVNENVVKELWTDVAPFLTTVANNQTTHPDDPQFKMFEHRNPWQKQTIYCNDAVAIGPDDDGDVLAVTQANSVGLPVVIDSSYVGLTVECWSADLTTLRGQAVITAMVAATSVTLKNLGTSSFTTVVGDLLYVIGTADEEGGTARQAWADELQVVWNSTQIFDVPVEITGTLLAAALRGETSELARLRTLKSETMKIQKERSMLFGKSLALTNLDQSGESFADSGRTAASGNLIRTTYGIVTAIEDYGNSSGDDQNIFTITEASYEWADWVKDTEKMFQYAPHNGMKRFFAGPGAMTFWNQMATTGLSGNSGWKIRLGDMKRDKLGFNYKILETPHGVAQLIPTHAFRGPRNKWMLGVDETNLFHAIYRKPRFNANIKTDDGYDGVKDQFWADEGIGITNIESHVLVKIN